MENNKYKYVYTKQHSLYKAKSLRDMRLKQKHTSNIRLECLMQYKTDQVKKKVKI